MRLVLGDQPFLGAPGSAGPLAGNPLDTAFAANVLGLEFHERLLRLDFDVEEPALPRRRFGARFGAAARCWFRARLGLRGLRAHAGLGFRWCRSLGARGGSPRRALAAARFLRLADVLAGGGFLAGGGHPAFLV